MKRVLMISVLFLGIATLAVGEEYPFFDRVWVFPGFVKRQKLIYENGEYRYHDEVWQGGLSESIWQDGRNFFDWGQMLYIDEGEIYLVNPREEIGKSSVENLRFMYDGYAVLHIEGFETPVIFGSFLFALPVPPNWEYSDRYDEQVSSAYNAQKNIWNSLVRNEESPMSLEYSTFLYQPIEEMIVPSCLSETIRGDEITYGKNFYKYRWVYDHGHVFANMGYLDGVPPWVEAEPGDGTGVEFEVLFKEPVDNIVFLNGFVDMQRKHLYKQNARMKEIRITGEGFSEEYSFIDQVRFQEFQFPRETERIKVKVLSVYPGSKWEDMAISGMYVRPHYDEISEEEKQRRYRLHVDFIKRMYEEQQVEREE